MTPLPTLAPMETVEDMDDDNFINARIRPFHDTDQVCQKIRDPSTARIWSQGPENPVDASRYNISFSQCMKMTVFVEIITTNRTEHVYLGCRLI